MKKVISITLLLTLLLPYGVNGVHANTDDINIGENRIISVHHTVYLLRDRNKHKIIKILKQKRESDDEDEDNIHTTTQEGYSKKYLKKEINRRKRLHKNLLDLYNKNFEEKYLDFIQSNALRIETLKKSYYTS